MNYYFITCNLNRIISNFKGINFSINNFSDFEKLNNSLIGSFDKNFKFARFL